MQNTLNLPVAVFENNQLVNKEILSWKYDELNVVQVGKGLVWVNKETPVAFRELAGVYVQPYVLKAWGEVRLHIYFINNYLFTYIGTKWHGDRRVEVAKIQKIGNYTSKVSICAGPASCASYTK